jgi:hypothetical protein
MRAAAAVVDQGITEMQTKVSIYIQIVFSLCVFRKCCLCDVTRITPHELHALSPHTSQLHTPRLSVTGGGLVSRACMREVWNGVPKESYLKQI